MLLGQRPQIDADQLAIFEHDATVNHGQPGLAGRTREQRRDGVPSRARLLEAVSAERHQI